MADQNLKIHLIGMKISIREGGGGSNSLITNLSSKFQNSKWRLHPGAVNLNSPAIDKKRLWVLSDKRRLDIMFVTVGYVKIGRRKV